MLEKKNKGGRPKGHKLSQATKDKISQALLGENHPGYGKQRPEDVRQKISKKLIGREFSQETKDLISIAKKSKNKGQKVYKELASMYSDKECVEFLEKNSEEITAWDDVVCEKDIYYTGIKCVDLDVENHICASCDITGDKNLDRKV